MHTTHPKVIGICTFFKTEFVLFFYTKTDIKFPQINVRSLCQGKACLQKTRPHGHCHMAGMKPTDLNQAPSDQLNIPSAGKGFIRENTALGVGFYSISLKAADPQFLQINSIIGRSCHKYHFCCEKNMFVVTKHVFCHDKNMFVATNICWTSLLLSQQNTSFVVTKACLLRQNFCPDKHNFVMTKLLSRQKWYLWQLLPMIELKPSQANDRTQAISSQW